MSQKQKLLLFLLVFSYCPLSFSQVGQAKEDSSAVYKDIQTYSKKNKFTKLLHKLIFEPVNVKIKKKRVLPRIQQKFEGKIIRNITIETLDPFGYSDKDSNREPKNWAEKTGNRIHLKTKKLAIRNLLLFRENKPLDSLLINESERLIRSQKYIRSVRIDLKLSEKNSDSVDVFIRVIDSWSLIPKGSVSSSRSSFELNEKNFMGIGHEFKNKFTNRFSDGKNAYNLDYTVPNIKNSFIKTTFKYNIDLDNYFGKSIDINRPFYSPFAKWAGGIYFDQQFRKDTLQDVNLVYAQQNFKYNSQDYWIGHAFSIFKGNTEKNRTTNLIVSGRYLNINYLESPTIAYDPVDFYSSEKLFLSGIGITSRKFIQDKYIFRNGIIEDVPIGKIYGITGGYQYKNHKGRFYLGGQASFGNYYDWGFLSTNFEVGTFFDKSTTSQTTFSFQINYFTHPIELGKWKLRQFIKPQVIIGLNRLNVIGDQLTINENYGIQGFNSAVYGTKKMMLTLQTQAYSPWDLWGFRLNPYFNYSIALLGNDQIGLLDSKAYSKIGIGLIINNDFLVFSSFQLSLSYYPSIPGSGQNIFKTNAFETSDFGFQDFELAKPRTVIFK
ncbi:hypothetical protein [Flavobacterium lacustre]|uniref:hypothetical protein n=1 Tax=Flavobacterium lacustre TaxID=3016339 RepID=UPI0022B7130B|nr:hypothetical protein [Flavobacterium lacustre]